MDYYSPFWGPKVISILVRSQGALTCRSYNCEPSLCAETWSGVDAIKHRRDSRRFINGNHAHENRSTSMMPIDEKLAKETRKIEIMPSARGESVEALCRHPSSVREDDS